ncbi:uncharacterized protein LOC123317543 [Coccinella septempunctata]|uniref:uncharacterized protein LOC123317543 n=1 Tax=Coccinella septempunctata TaxID=41139 RepID=UPI001D07B47B|nr:uncharacterized protein LOC123317543 [Coccinella septempunctata]
MFCDKILIFVVIGSVLNVVNSAPQLGGETASCFDYQCPPRTTGCKKVTKTSEDKATLVETVVCLDIQDYELDKHTKTSPNPYGPNTHYESTSFTGSYTFTSGGNLKPININHMNRIGNTNDEVEFL